MNQILVTEKLYVTPELKKKRKWYRLEFFLSVFLVCLLFSYYIYAEYDKNKSEVVSKDILGVDIEKKEDDTTIKTEDNVLVVVLDENEDPHVAQEEPKRTKPNAEVMRTKSGQEYTKAGAINIETIGVNYPILSDTSDELLKIAPNKFWGPDANEVGNYCIVGHNYRNKRFFSKVPTLKNGDIIEITDLTGRTIKYSVYSKYIVEPDDVSCTSQLTNGKKEVTLITCTDNSKQRVIVKATEVL